MTESPVHHLADLARLRSAPELLPHIKDQLRQELTQAMGNARWFTIGVMAPSADQALSSLRSVEASQQWTSLEVVETTTDEGPVFLKANQRGGTVRVRIEHGLGSGILISGHGEDDTQPATTWGPFPLDFFG